VVTSVGEARWTARAVGKAEDDGGSGDAQDARVAAATETL
jgi:hypothetical protein